MFHSRGLNNKINRIHKRALRITHNEKSSSYTQLLTKDSSVTIIDHRNIKALAKEIYKVMSVTRQCNYDFRGNNFLEKKS